MKTTKHNLLCLGLAAAGASTVSSRAEEAAGGHYIPGATATFIDALPGKTAFVVADAFTYYDGKASVTRPILFNGLLTLDAHATVYADTVFGLYQTPLQLLGGNYAAGIAIPYMWMEVKGQVQATGPLPGSPPPVSMRDTANGVGDITIYPFILGWTNAMDLKYDVRLGIYAPTGPYEAGRLANTGRNFWTFEPGVSLSWLSTKIGTEVSLFAGVDISTKKQCHRLPERRGISSRWHHRTASAVVWRLRRSWRERLLLPANQWR